MPHPLVIAAIGQLPHDDAVLIRAHEVAQACRGKLGIVHVLDLPGSDADLNDPSSLLGRTAQTARDTIKSALASHDITREEIEIRIMAGAHALQLIALCEERSPDLVVMRAHQRTDIADKLLGSTTERLIAADKSPVLVVKTPADAPYMRVTLATNGSDQATDAVTCVKAFFPHAQLKLVQVVQIPPQLEEAMLRVGTTQSGLAEQRDELARTADAHLSVLAETAGLNVATQVLHGDPANVLASLCRGANVDLLALGRGRSGLIRRAFIGSVSRRLLREAACDVLICGQAPGATS
ncbi:universal stress protein [Marivita sp. S2033]|uniref:universal stress protein n=1 Tax=Marivita sp. S2033 TaxID=3373187 RepID=UPI003982C774